MRLCQLGISLDALFQANPTKKQNSPHRGSGLCVEELSSKSSVLLHLHIFYLLKSTPRLKSLWRVVSPRTSIWHKTPRHEWGLSRYFRMKDTNLIMLEMFDSCQGETGRTDGVVSSQGSSTLFLEGSSVSWQEKMTLSFEGINVLNLHNQPETILSLTP